MCDVGKISDIPKLKAQIAQRMDQLGGQGVGMSDKAAVTAGLVTPEEFDKRLRREDEIFRSLVEMARRRGLPDHSGMNCRTALTDPNCGEDSDDTTARLLAENERLTQQLADAQATSEKFGRMYYQEKDNRHALERRNADLELANKHVHEMRQATTRFNPATGRDEPWNPIAALDDVVSVLRSNLSRTGLTSRYEGFTLPGVVAELVKDLSTAEARLAGMPGGGDPAECAALLGLKAVKVEPGMLLAIREPGPDSPVPPSALKRMANALLSELTRRFGSMTYGAPTVLAIPHGAEVESVSTGGRGPVQVNILPEGHAARPTDVPKHVARAYAEAAAKSYGVTPEAVQERRKTRNLRRALAARVNRRIATDEPPFITPAVRAETKPIGQVLDWGDAEAFLADAEG